MGDVEGNCDIQLPNEITGSRIITCAMALPTARGLYADAPVVSRTVDLESRGTAMSIEDNKMLVRRQFDEIWNGAKWDTVDELFATDYVNHDPYNPNQATGPEGFKERVSGYRHVLHDFDLKVERQIGEGDLVETHWSLRGVHRGELEGTAPTGKSIYVDGQLLSRIVDGKFVEEWVHWDTLGLLRQIGAVPAARS
jgi:steroid delta-isomerase-like uncharacterized protein